MRDRVGVAIPSPKVIGTGKINVDTQIKLGTIENTINRIGIVRIDSDDGSGLM